MEEKNVLYIYNKEDKDSNTDLVELIKVLWSKIIIIAIALVVGAVVGGVGTSIRLTDMYEATSKAFICGNVSRHVTDAGMTLRSQTVSDAVVLATSHEVIEAVIADLGTDETYESIVSKIDVSNESNTRFVFISVTDSDAEEAANLCNAVAEELVNKVNQLTGVEGYAVVDKASLPTSPLGKPVIKNAVICGAGLAAVLVVFYSVRFIYATPGKTKVR